MLSRIFSPFAKAESSETHNSRLGYLPALDGLRALAILAVLFYHADVLWLPGGFLGVEIFFVVSGYLITSLLLAEYRARNTINLKQFWQRRARRLLPALFAMITAVLIYAVILLPDEVASLRADALAAFTYITNWYLIVAQKSYFEAVGRPSLLQHLWSLAVEEQFYLLWPLIFAFVLTRLKTRGAMLLLMFGATASALWMGFLFQPDTDPSRIYYGTDTRAAGLLIGAALAFVWTPRAQDEKPSIARRWLLDGVGVAALGALIVACLFLSEFDPFLYQGGMLLVAAATALVIAAVTTPNSPILASLMGVGILRWIGLRSYSLYLWHWPVFMVTRPQLDTTLEGLPLLGLRLALTFALAEISFRIIETPIRKGALGKAWNAWYSAQGARQWGLSFVGIGLSSALIVGAVLLGSALLRAQPTQEPNYVLTTSADETVSYEEQTAAQQSETTPETAETESATSSDLSPVSFLILEQEPAANAKDITLASPAIGAWIYNYRVERITAPTSALANTAQTLASPRATVDCDEKCQVRAEFADAATAGKSSSTTTNVAAVPPAPLVDAQVLAIGDSVMLGASNYLRKTITAVDVDAKIGRQVSTALQLLRERQDAHLLAPVIVIHLGNNGRFSEKQFDEMMTVLKDVPHVIFLTTKVPRKWQEPNNNALVEGVKRYPNAVLVDWNSVSSAHPEWFWKDGIHLRPDGAQVYANLIAETISQTQVQ